MGWLHFETVLIAVEPASAQNHAHIVIVASVLVGIVGTATFTTMCASIVAALVKQLANPAREKGQKVGIARPAIAQDKSPFASMRI